MRVRLPHILAIATALVACGSNKTIVRGAHDHTVNSELERAAAKRMDATTYEIDSDHVPMMSHPETALTAIRNLVKSRQDTLASA